jgi:hypothetical protein
MMGGWGGYDVYARNFWYYDFSQNSGGGKCPEEEHTTCSGGPTIVIVTSAVYGERHYFI